MAREATGEWDYVIVGAGSAGCVLARRLSEDPGTRVLLLEAGGEDKTPFIRFPAGFLRIKAKYNWRYLAEPDPSINGTIERWSAGRVLGGSSSINVTAWSRGHRGDYDNWASLGCTGWDYEHVLPYFRRAESFEGGASTYRGDHGPQHVSFSRVDHPLTDAFVASAAQAGLAFTEDLNGALQEGVGYSQVSQHRGLRDSTATSFLRGARRRANLTLVKHAFATRVLIEDGRAVGVEYRRGARTVVANARREVIVSAGAIGSPKLLLLSGIGPKEELESLGIEVVADLPGVGRNLQDHPVMTFVYGVNRPTLNMELNWWGVLRHGWAFVVHRRGGATASGSTAVGYTKRTPASTRPDFEINFRPLAVGKALAKAPGAAKEQGDFSAMSPLKVAAVQSGAWLCHPASRGRVSLRSKDPGDGPVIAHQVIGAAEDVEALIAACQLLRRIFAQEAFSPYVTGEIVPGPGVQSVEEFEQWLHAEAHRGNHPSGTCKMGVDAEAVVDPELRVRGLSGLRVVDASVMPNLITGHTNAPVIMIAERASDLIRGAAVARR